MCELKCIKNVVHKEDLKTFDSSSRQLLLMKQETEFCCGLNKSRRHEIVNLQLSGTAAADRF